MASVTGSGARTRRWRARKRMERARTWEMAHAPLVRAWPALEGWFARGLLYPPSPPQLHLLLPLVMAHPDAARQAVAAMSPVPQVGRTYALVGAMVAAARAVLHSLAPLGPPPKIPPPGGLWNARAAVMTDELEADRRGADGSVDSTGARPETRPTGIAAFRALREPGGIFYPGPPAPDPSARDRLAVRRARVRHMRRGAHRSIS